MIAAMISVRSHSEDHGISRWEREALYVHLSVCFRQEGRSVMELDELTEKYSLNSDEREELEQYIANRFDGIGEGRLQPDGQIRVWRKLSELAEKVGAAKVINAKVCPKYPVDLFDPEQVMLGIFDSFAGEIPVICAADTRDFEALVTNIVFKGVRPANIGQTGASFVSGSSTRFIILSKKPYSNVPAAELDLDDADWAERSMLLRLSHECTHFYTKLVYGRAENNLHDELIADFIGMWDAFGFYRAEWFLRFMGVISGSGGRLLFYTKDLPENVRRAVSRLAEIIACGLESWSLTEGFRAMTIAERIKWMCRTGLEGMLQN